MKEQGLMRGGRRTFSPLEAHPCRANISPDGVVFGIAEKLGTEVGHCWSHIFSLFPKQNFLGCVLGTFEDEI
jgi:hypothetical protein